MSVTVYFGNTNKRRNSTLQGSFSTPTNCVLKDATSLDRPTFLVSAATMDYNTAKWNNRYYFIDDVVSVRNNQWEVSCVLDVLATYKADILASTQYVCYSASTTGDATWLADTRIPVLKETQVKKKSVSLSDLFNTTGFYVLSVIGKDACDTFAVNKNTLTLVLDSISNWANSDINAIMAGLPVPTGGSLTTEAAIDSLTSYARSLANAMIRSDFFGNAYAQAPSCLRSCLWVPFDLAAFTSVAGNIWLGNYDTNHAGFKVNANPTVNTVTVDIPWTYSDWRRSTCESVYLYLPLVGVVQISGDSITHVSQLTITYSATATDGVVCYEVKAGSEVIGTYGGQCSANYPLGVNQQASAGEVVNVLMAGAEKAVNAAINSSISPVSAASVAAGVSMAGIETVYNTTDAIMSTHVSSIGGIGGGAGVGLDLNAICYTVCHPTIVSPSSMAATMGRPVMKPMTLSTLTGYCQCANAHVAANAQARELDAIDYFLNSGFYIE